MKFNAVMNDPSCMKDFSNLIGTISKLAKEVVCCIKDDGITILGEGDMVHGIPLYWITIGKADFFAQYKMNGVDENNTSIYLSFNPIKFSGALGHLKSSVNFVQIKLTKKQFPCLSIKIEGPSANSTANRQIVHDVPVTIIPVRDWPDHEPPTIPTCQVTATMPTLKSLKSLCDKMKNLSPSLTICCDLNGDLIFVAETDSAMVASRYFNLNVTKLENSDAPIDGNEVSCRVDSKQLALCFSSNQFQHIRMTGNILQDELFNIVFNVRSNVQMNCLIYAVNV